MTRQHGRRTSFGRYAPGPDRLPRVSNDASAAELQGAIIEAATMLRDTRAYDKMPLTKHVEWLATRLRMRQLSDAMLRS